ncbi:hypothetical protein [Spirosoma sordidisoli]|uniref:Uncharacterized protein n=1 Tax=Spirosoma sordidisoli TaxID=2502893 RepID=A0A4V1RVG1_9BACT|nr:hypothetical protein [Spirosoma sordidisoli]RYC66648.1 hypothetical protein EQG79_29100 [Spirosoma sordidisoli]
MAVSPSTFVWEDQHFVIPFGVMHSRAIRSQPGELVNFEVCSFNHYATLDLPALQDWYRGATFWELFRQDARQGLFLAYQRVLSSAVTQEEIYYSPATGKEYYSLLKPWQDGVLAIGLALDRLDQLDQPKTLVLQSQPGPPPASNCMPSAQPDPRITSLSRQMTACQKVVYSYCQTLFSV